jgi:hypothetical protein
MRCIFRQSIALLLSLTLAMLPLQQAMAASDMSQVETTHCAEASDMDMSQQSEMAANGCCCDNCDEGCAQNCSQHINVSWLPAADNQAASTHQSEFYGLLKFYSDRNFSPPSPPPLS